ncbi:NADPH-dependent F420 reductase [Mesorhizobium sp. B2-3-5]|uniref:NADPH-dependent F420 reductase n=1 Tax=Mesorhizobium sp. B2-3-5 TaxID=2589958 RepID=UPI00112A3E72|nr:NADPH-dependent F420 reductase [Mesorhizobium sp. B2-3-5]TPM26931.1 NADPH-dependent F420 reductase [Mesorhizobium sp. B2-3-5]
MNITILGAGNMGAGLAKTLSRAGHGIVIGARDVAKAQTAAASLGPAVHAAPIEAAVRSADVIILAVPYDAVASLVKGLDLSGKVVVDITNPLTPDYMGLTIGHSTSAAEQIQALIPTAHVVKAFNTVFAQILQGEPKIAGERIPVYVAGDDAAAKGTVSSVATSAGFAAVDAGGLKTARYLEPLAGLNILFGYGLGHGTAIAPAWLRAA